MFKVWQLKQQTWTKIGKEREQAGSQSLPKLGQIGPESGNF